MCLLLTVDLQHSAQARPTILIVASRRLLYQQDTCNTAMCLLVEPSFPFQLTTYLWITLVSIFPVVDSRLSMVSSLLLIDYLDSHCLYRIPRNWPNYGLKLLPAQRSYRRSGKKCSLRTVHQGR